MLFSLLKLSTSILLEKAIAARKEEVVPKKVEIVLLYESLCPYCQTFLTQQLSPVIGSPIGDYLSVKLVPFGNTIMDLETVDCQHGVAECYFNDVEACALSHFPIASRWPFILCTEQALTGFDNKSAFSSDLGRKIWSSCAGHNSGIIDKCLSSEEITILREKNASLTAAYSKKFVPWVVIDGTYSENAEHDLRSAVCGSLGRSAPKACLNDLDEIKRFMLAQA